MTKNLKLFLLLLMAGMFGMLLTVSCGADDVLSDVEDATGTDEPVPADNTGNTVATRNIVERMLSLNAETTAVLCDTRTEQLTGDSIEVYKECYKGIDINNTRCVVVYDKSGGAKIYANSFVKIDYLDTNPSLTEAEAAQIALDYTHADLYAWEDTSAYCRKFYPTMPKGELLIHRPYNSKTQELDEPCLAYKFVMATIKPKYDEFFLYVDAHDGKVIRKEPGLIY